MIYHIVTEKEWQKAIEEGSYAAESLSIEGFIHTSKKEQVNGVLERYYQNKTNLLLLHINESKVSAMIKFEHANSVNEEFPHIFGRLNLDAVVEITSISS